MLSLAPAPQTPVVSRRRLLLRLIGASGLIPITGARLGLAGMPVVLPMSADAALPAGEALAWPAVHLLDGSAFSGAQWRGSVLVVVFFALSCTYCHRHNRRLQALWQHSRAQGLALQVLGVVHDRDSVQIQRHLQTEGLKFPVTQDEQVLHALLSPRRITPLTCVIDKSGCLREIIPGEMSETDVMGLARWAHQAEAHKP